MKLYFTRGACSFGPHMVVRELDADCELAAVNLQEKTLPDGSDFRAVNPKGYVPFLQTDDVGGISECSVILQYLADRHPDSGLAPSAETPDRYRLQEWLSFIGLELHKTLPPLFLPGIPDEYRSIARGRVTQRLGYLDSGLEGRNYLMGDAFSVADAYACAVLNWTKPAKYDLSAHPNVAAYFDRLRGRDSYAAVRAAEAAAA